MSVSRVQGTSQLNDGGGGTSGTATVILTAVPTVGNLVCIGFAAAYGTNNGTLTVTSIVDSNGNSYVRLTTGLHDSTDTISAGYLFQAPANASATININWTATNAFFGNGNITVIADEFTPVASFDNFATAVTSASNIVSPSFTPSGGIGFLYAFAGGQGVIAPASGATLGVWTGAVLSLFGDCSEFTETSTTTAVSFTQGGVQNCPVIVMGFIEIPRVPMQTIANDDDYVWLGGDYY